VEHVDPEVLALVALGEPAADDDARAHLSTCAQCADEVAALAEVVLVGRSGTHGETLVTPPPAVWDRIRDELGLPAELVPTDPSAQATADDPAGGAGAPARAERAPRPVAAPGSDAPAPTHEPGADARVVDLAARRRRRVPWVAAAAAAGLVVGGAGGALWVDRVRDEAAAQVLAQVVLDPFPGWSATGDAVVEEAPDGTRTLVVSVEDDGGVDDGGYREVWLIDTDVTRLVSLGVLDGPQGRFTIPAGLDLTDFPVVDVSEEQFDGDPAHSGDSIVRGILPA
jgi:hypothetical protein